MLSREKFEKYNIYIFDVRSLRQTKNIYPVYQTLTSTSTFNQHVDTTLLYNQNATFINRQFQRSTNVETTLLYDVKMSHLLNVNLNVQPTLRQRYYAT